jgi:hypothetical protein
MIFHWFCCFDTLFHLNFNCQSNQIFGNCNVSSCDFFSKAKAHFPPNYIFISFLYLKLLRWHGSQQGWTGIKRPLRHTKKSKRPPKFLHKAPFQTFCMGNCKSPCNQHCTMAGQSKVNCNFATNITKLNLFILCFPAQ